MATPPDFSVGQILTSATMNLAAMWLIKTQTVGSAVSTVSVTNAFSADYENYFITYNGGVGSGTGAVTLKIGNAATAYYGFLQYGAPNANTVLGLGINNDTVYRYAGGITTNSANMKIYVMNPFLTTRTLFSNQYISVTPTGAHGVTNGHLDNANSYTSFELGTTSGTLTGGEIRVYGYRK
jgi:hypothetical protein